MMSQVSDLATCLLCVTWPARKLKISVYNGFFVGEVRLGTPLHLPLIDGYKTNTISITPTIEEWFVHTRLE